MSRSVRNSSDVIKFLCKTKPHYRKALLKSADKDLIHSICECVYNILIGKVPLAKSQKVNISKHKTTLRRLLKPGVSFRSRKKLIIQKGGGFLPLLLTPIISGVLSSLFNK